MSAYEAYDPPPREQSRRHHKERLDPRYEDPYYRVAPSSRNELIPRAREDSDLSVEEVHRDFPPPGYARDRRARSAEPGYDDYYYDTRSRDPRSSRRAGSVYYEEEERARKRVLSKQQKIMAAVVGGVIAAGAKEVWDRREAKEEGFDDVQRNVAASAALGAAGALAGYQGASFYNKHNSKEDKKSTYMVHKGRDGRVSEYYSDDEDDRRGHKGNKNFLESALSAAGLGGAIKALTGGDDDRRSDRRSRHGSPDSRRSRSKSRDTPAHRMQKAAKASLVAGAAEAFRVAKEPGAWKGEKMKRVLTAAAGAATIDAAQDPTKGGKRHLMESVIGGLVGNRVLNGSRKGIEEDSYTGRSRSRSRARSGSRGGLAALATAGLGALGAKKALGRSASRSRSRRGSADSYDTRDRSPRRRRSRSRSIVDGARRSLAKVGLGNGPDEHSDDDYYYDDRSPRGGSRRRSLGDRDRYDDDYASRGYMRGGRGDDYYDDDDRYVESRRRSRSRPRGSRSGSVAESDLGDSDDDEKRHKKMRGKQLLSTGMAAVATVHAANTAYGFVKKRDARHKAVAEGRLSPEEARKLKTKAILQDVASVGIATITVQGAVGSLKEAHANTKSVKEWSQEKTKRHEKRMERLKSTSDSHYGRSRADGWSTASPIRQDRYGEALRYADANPYAAAGSLPVPPVGVDNGT